MERPDAARPTWPPRWACSPSARAWTSGFFPPQAKRDGNLDNLLKDISKADLLILDEFGYVPFDIDGARLLYQVIASSYERRSIIFTTNIEFSKWGTVFADDKLAAAIIDRIVHHGQLIEFTGPSHRIGEALMFGKNQPQ